jgi:macrodomain Ter protein organizer (MatP/YcbG family)
MDSINQPDKADKKYNELENQTSLIRWIMLVLNFTAGESFSSNTFLRYIDTSEWSLQILQQNWLTYDMSIHLWKNRQNATHMTTAPCNSETSH